MKKILVILLTLISSLKSERILFVYPSLSVSHMIPLQTLSLLLAERGHEVTFVSAFPQKKPIKNYRDIVLPFNEDDKKFIEDFIKTGVIPSTYHILTNVPKMIYKPGNDTLQSPEVRRLMREEKFDLLIFSYFMTEFVLGLGDHFKCPTIVFSSAGTVSTLSGMVGNPLSVSASPHFIKQGLDLRTFSGRLQNFFINAIDILIVKQVFKYYGKQVYDFNFPPDKYRSYEESIRNVSLVLLNIHYSSSPLRPYLPNMVEVGGLQVKPTPAPLPDDLKKFLNEAKEGAILFSLGSNAKSSFLPKKTISMLMGAFKRVKQRVVMKWETDFLEGKPDNVFISKWLPQDDILAHKNIKAFISHCGYGGVIEAKYHGVPIIGVPLFGDQPGNADTIEQEGWGIKIDLSASTEDSLVNVIDEIINNPKYAKNVEHLSKLAKDRVMNAQDTAIFWVEYVMRHHGAPHLHYTGADLNFFQDNSIDVIAFFLIILYLIFKAFIFIFKFICCKKKAQKFKKQ